MGYPMAVNLRKGLGKEYTLLICDVNKDAIIKFQKQMEGQGPIEVVETGVQAVSRSVCPFNTFLSHFQVELNRIKNLKLIK